MGQLAMSSLYIFYISKANFCLGNILAKWLFKGCIKLVGSMLEAGKGLCPKPSLSKLLTIAYPSFKFILIQQLLEGLFQNVDADKDDYITYSDYFTLRGIFW